VIARFPVRLRRWFRPASFFILFLCLQQGFGSEPASGKRDLQDFIQAISWPLYQDEAVRLLQEYLRIDTSNPPGNETRAASFYKKLFDEAGIPNTVYPYAPGRADFYAVL
jgi:hypothetical protein